MTLIKTIIDWETAYGIHPETKENLTLSKTTTEEYIRHPKFRIHGLGVKIDSDNPFYLYGKPLLDFLRSHPWDKSYVVAHHTHFDGAILSWRLGIRPAFLGCTLSMGRAIFPYASHSLDSLAKRLGLGEKGKELSTVKDLWELTDEQQQVLGGYCLNDIDLTDKIFTALLPKFSLSELRLIDLTLRMFTEPVLRVDRPVLVEDFKREKRKKRAALKQCGVEAGDLASNDKMADLLITLGIDPPKKLSPAKVKNGRVDPDTAGEPPLGRLPSFKGWKGMTDEEKVQLKAEKDSYPWAYAFGKNDEEFKLLLDHPDEKISALVGARMSIKSTIKETRSKRFYKIGKRGAFPVYLSYYGAHTGRPGGGDKVNPLNMGRVDPKDPTSGALRKSWLAPEGHVLCVRDSGQAECRKLSFVSGQDDVIEMFKRGGDPYNRQATQIFGYEVNRKDPKFYLEGLAGKASVLGCGYNMGWSKFQGSLRVGFMGMPPLLFSPQDAEKLGVDFTQFCTTKSWKKGYANLREEALSLKPLNVGEEAHVWHCAAVKQIVDKYRETNPAVVNFWKECQQALAFILIGERRPVGCHDMVHTCPEGFELPNGMIIRYHKLHKTKAGEFKYLSNEKKKEWSYIYGGKATENIVQALINIIVNGQMLAINDWLYARRLNDPGRVYKVVTMTYDEIVTCVPEYAAEETMSEMKRIMSIAPSWCAGLPLKSSGGYAVNYGECEK